MRRVNFPAKESWHAFFGNIMLGWDAKAATNGRNTHKCENKEQWQAKSSSTSDRPRFPSHCSKTKGWWNIRTSLNRQVSLSETSTLQRSRSLCLDLTHASWMLDLNVMPFCIILTWEANSIPTTSIWNRYRATERNCSRSRRLQCCQTWRKTAQCSKRWLSDRRCWYRLSRNRYRQKDQGWLASWVLPDDISYSCHSATKFPYPQKSKAEKSVPDWNSSSTASNHKTAASLYVLLQKEKELQNSTRKWKSLPNDGRTLSVRFRKHRKDRNRYSKKQEEQ